MPWCCCSHLYLTPTPLLILQVYFEDEDRAELYRVPPKSTLLQVLQHPRWVSSWARVQQGRCSPTIPGIQPGSHSTVNCLVLPTFYPGHKTVRWQPWRLARPFAKQVAVWWLSSLHCSHAPSDWEMWVGLVWGGKSCLSFVSEDSWDGPTAPNCALSPDFVIRKEHWLLKPDTIVSWLCDCKHTLPLWG